VCYQGEMLDREGKLLVMEAIVVHFVGKIIKKILEIANIRVHIY